jgi:hypothetical protein
MKTLYCAIILLIIATDVFGIGNPKKLLWFGFGESEGKYEEKFYEIDEEIKGYTLEYSEYQYFPKKSLRSLIPNSTGKTKSFFLHYTLFDIDIEDNQKRKHKLSFTELIPHWGRGYSYTVHMGDKINMHTSIGLFLGLGIITFKKEIENANTFDHKFGYDLSYGFSMNWIWFYDDRLFLGWRSVVKENRITLQMVNENGYLTHRRDIFLVFGGTFSGSAPSCVETLYVKC